MEISVCGKDGSGKSTVVAPLADIPPQHMLSRDDIALGSIAKIHQSLERCACPMGVLCCEFLSVLIVVEPPFERLEPAAKVNSLAAGIGISNIWAILNKITSAELASRLEAELLKRGITAIGYIHYYTEIFETCLEGHPVYSRKATEDVDKLLDTL